MTEKDLPEKQNPQPAQTAETQSQPPQEPAQEKKPPVKKIPKIVFIIVGTLLVLFLGFQSIPVIFDEFVDILPHSSSFPQEHGFLKNKRTKIKNI